MATQGKVANRYARAIFEIAREKDADKLIDELLRFRDLLTSNRDLSNALVTGPFASEQRAEIVREVCGKLKLSDLATRTLLTLSDNHRLDVLGVLLQRMEVLAMESENVAGLHVRAADALSDELKKKLEAKFKKVLGKEVRAEYHIDPSLIAGLHITAGGRTYDGSVAGWLNSFEEQLVGGSI